MPHRMGAAAFQQVDESEHVALHVGERIFQRVTHAGLTGEIDGYVEGAFGKEFFQTFAVLKVHFHEAEIRGTFKRDSVLRRFFPYADHGQPGQLEFRGIVVVELVDTRDGMSELQQLSGKKAADETGGAGDEYVHRRSFSVRRFPSREPEACVARIRALILFCNR